MSEELKANMKINLEGLLCPIPVARISKAIKKLPVGAILEATATDPGVLADIPAWARTTGNEVIKMGGEGKLVRFYVRRVK